jgi:hypothetical protein
MANCLQIVLIITGLFLEAQGKTKNLILYTFSNL